MGVPIPTPEFLPVGTTRQVVIGDHTLTSTPSIDGVTVTAQAATDIPLTVKAAGSQTANLAEWKDSSNVILNRIDHAGYQWTGDTTPMWNDWVVYASNLRTGATPPTFAAFLGGIYGYNFSATIMEELFGTIEYTHDYQEGTDADFHIHWSPDTNAAGNVVWGVEYTIQNISGVPFPAPTVATPVTIAAGGVAKNHKLTDLVTIPGTGRKIGDILYFRVYRDGAAVGDTYGGVCWLHSIGVHYKANTIGSRQEAIK